MPAENSDLLGASLEELQREKRLVETLYRIAEVVARKHDLHEIVQVVTDESTALTGAQFGAYFSRVGRDRYTLYVVSSASPDAERIDAGRATEIFHRTFDGTGVVRLEDARLEPVLSRLTVPVLAPGGEVVGGLLFAHEESGAFTDVHERIADGVAMHAGIAIDKARLLEAARTARAEAEVRVDATVALEFVEDGVIMLDGRGVVRLWNRAADRITGLAAPSVLGRPIGEAVPGWERIALDIPLGDPLGSVAPATLPLDTLRGRELWLSVYGVTFDDGTVYSFRDVSEQRELDVLRADVIATVSHELRTPIAAVYGAAQTLRNRELSPELRERLFQIVDEESARLTLLVEEILLTSQIDSGRLDVVRARIDPRDAILAATSVAGESGASIDVDAPAALSPVAADPEKLRQVLGNLIENAIKYGTLTGSTSITVRAVELRERIRFEVVDHGPGIPGSEQSRVFEKFYRLDPHLKQGVRGTGLGLYISRELVHRMHGSIGVDSLEGAGATFWVELPRA